MFRARWRTLNQPPLIPPLIVVGTAALISLAAAQLAVAAPLFATSVASDCSTAGAVARAIARNSGSTVSVTQRFDSSGTYIGRALSVDARPSALSLPAESFVAQPEGDALIYTTSVAGKSEVHLIDLANGCDALIGIPIGTVRSAILSADGTAVYAHSVTYPNRVDTGVTRYSLDGSLGIQVVPPAPDDPDFGPTFGTQLGWSSDDGTLSVQSCGIDSCRTRLLDVGSGHISTLDAKGQGRIIGVTPRHLVTFAACDSIPCSVLSADRSTELVTMLADEAWSATLAGDVLRMSTAAGVVEVEQ